MRAQPPEMPPLPAVMSAVLPASVPDIAFSRICLDSRYTIIPAATSMSCPVMLRPRSDAR
jgi:hypothetical protein